VLSVRPADDNTPKAVLACNVFSTGNNRVENETKRSLSFWKTRFETFSRFTGRSSCSSDRFGFYVVVHGRYTIRINYQCAYSKSIRSVGFMFEKISTSRKRFPSTKNHVFTNSLLLLTTISHMRDRINWQWLCKGQLALLIYFEPSKYITYKNTIKYRWYAISFRPPQKAEYVESRVWRSGWNKV